jgi:hypothetical protein
MTKIKFVLDRTKVSEKTLKALHMNVMSKPSAGDYSVDYDAYKEIKSHLRLCCIGDFRPCTPLMPEGNLMEMLGGKTEPINDEHFVFEATFNPTIFGASTKNFLIKKLSASRYFKIVTYSDIFSISEDV